MYLTCSFDVVNLLMHCALQLLIYSSYFVRLAMKSRLQKDWIFSDLKKLTLLPEWLVLLHLVGPNWGFR